MTTLLRKVLLFVLNHTSRLYPDKLFLILKFYLRNGEKLNLKSPQTFMEKLQWLKLYARDKGYTKMVDKISAKEYVASIIGQEYVIPTIKQYNSVDEIDFASLPNQFVLKCSHDSGGVVVCKDKNLLDVGAVKKKIKESLSRNFYWKTREYPYKDVCPRIFVEKYLDNDGDELRDYKFFCFNGNVLLCQVISDRFYNEKIDFYDIDWKRIDGMVGLAEGVENSADVIPKPIHFEQMVDNAKKLSQGIPFVRIDQYEVKGHIYFGEITFFPNSGFGSFSPKYWNEILGKWLVLPCEK